MSFYNTTGETGQLLMDFKEAARNQDRLVLAVFKASTTPLTPSQVWKILINNKSIHQATPLTSIRRSINTLTGRMELVKLNKKRPGPMGRPEGYWELNKEATIKD